MTKAKYVKPSISRVKFQEKELISFAVCRKQTQLENDSASCCNILPFNTPSMDSYDPS